MPPEEVRREATNREERAEALRRALLAWFPAVRHARQMPWRSLRDPYAVWVSETMLQQTRVETVIPYFRKFVEELPTVLALAEATESRVLSLWSGLGYYRRARMLHAAARRVVAEHEGRIPGEVEALRRLEGVGAYTAGAVASIAFGARAAAVDGNVARVLSRVFAIEEQVSSGPGRMQVVRLAEDLVPQPGQGEPGAWNESLMELGSTVCTARKPACEACPARTLCLARERGLEATLPRAARKKPPREVRRAAMVVVSASGVLLARRRAGGLFGGLWEVPVADGEAEAIAMRLGIAAGRSELVGEVVHLLTHRRMVIAVWRASVRKRSWPVPGDDYEAVEWVRAGPKGEILDGRPHANLTRKVLALAVR